MTSEQKTSTAHRIIRAGFILFLLGLLAGLAVPLLENPRMGLSSHLEGILNGLFLIGLGIVWPRLKLGAKVARITVAVAIYGTFANWAATFLAAAWGAGAMMPIAGGVKGLAYQEAVVSFLLLTLTAAMIFITLMVIWGLRSAPSVRA